MSDCSIQAMQPKKRPEVCPNCEYFMTEHASEYESSLVHLHCDNCGCSITREKKEPQTLSNCCPYCGNPTPHANAIRNRQYSIDEAINDAWKEKQSLEQRYQQLEQVAKMMFGDFERARLLANEGCYANALTVVLLSFNTYEGELEALGVSIDD